MNQMQKKRLDIFDLLIGALLIAMILLAPLPFGSASPWAKSAVFLLALYMTAFWLLQCARRGRIKLCPSPLWFFIPAVMLVAGLQLVPLPPGVLQALSPATAEAYAQTLEGWPESGEARTLSLNPHATLTTLAHWTALALIVIVVMNTVRTRSQITALVVALVAAGSFQVLYGFAEQFSGHKHVFWNAREYHLNAVTGTFHNKNHFAGLLEMIVPVSIGLLIALNPWRNRGALIRARIIHYFSAAGTNRQIMLGVCVCLMILGIFFSLSRAGILSAVGSWAGFAVVLSLAAGFRKYTVVLLFVVLLTLCLSMGIGAELVIDGIEDAASGESSSWVDRVNLWQSGLAMTETFPLLGAGLGTFAVVFERFQSMRFGDRYADFLHNDWLQVFCELGLIGGLLVVSGVILVLYRLLRKTFMIHDPYCRWMALGCMMGVAAMLLHSVFDYNLYKITSNGIVFAVILGLWHAAVSLHQRQGGAEGRYVEIPLPSRGIGWAIVGLACLVLAVPAAWAIRTGSSDIYFNRFLACPEINGRTDAYHFLPVNEEEYARSDENLGRALALNPQNPRHRFYASLNELARADEKVKEKAGEMAQAILGSEMQSCDPGGYQNIVDSLVDCLKPQMSGENKPHLLEAEKYLREAVDLSPCVAPYHLRLASVISQLNQAESSLHSSMDSIGQAKVALWLAPNKPYALFEVGQVCTAAGFAPDGLKRKEEYLEFAATCFKSAIKADPEYADPVYALVQASMGDKDALMRVTPDTIPGYEKLIDTLWQSGLWNDVLTCLDAARQLLGHENRTEAVVVDEQSPLWRGRYMSRDSEAFKRISREESMRDISNKRCTVLGILGDWNERAIEVSRHGRLMRKSVEEWLHQARELRKKGRYDESLSLYLKSLQRDWGNHEALLEAASIACLPNTLDNLPSWNRPIDLLFRVVIHSEELSESVLKKTLEILDSLRLEENEDHLMGELIRGAACVLAGRIDEGRYLLENLAPRAEQIGESWRQRHLVWHYLGKIYEKMGEEDLATSAYRKVIRDVPTHVEALEKLALLEDEDRSLEGSETGNEGRVFVTNRLEDITPEIPCRVNFGGKIELLGLSLSLEETEDSSEKAWYMTYYWRFKDRMQEGSYPVIQFCDESWQVRFHDNHQTRYMNDRIYPVNFPRTGEIVKEKRRLSGDPGKAKYLRISIYSANPGQPGATYLTHDGGDIPFTTTVEALASGSHTEAPRSPAGPEKETSKVD